MVELEGRGLARPRERPRDQFLRLLLDLPQMVLARKALRVELLDVLGSRRPRRKPSAPGRHLQPSERSAVAGRGREHGLDRISGQLVRAHLLGREPLQYGLLLRGGGRVDAFVNRRAEPVGEAR